MKVLRTAKKAIIILNGTEEDILVKAIYNEMTSKKHNKESLYVQTLEHIFKEMGWKKVIEK